MLKGDNLVHVSVLARLMISLHNPKTSKLPLIQNFEFQSTKSEWMEIKKQFLGSDTQIVIIDR